MGDWTSGISDPARSSSLRQGSEVGVVFSALTTGGRAGSGLLRLRRGIGTFLIKHGLTSKSVKLLDSLHYIRREGITDLVRRELALQPQKVSLHLSLRDLDQACAGAGVLQILLRLFPLHHEYLVLEVQILALHAVARGFPRSHHRGIPIDSRVAGQERSPGEPSLSGFGVRVDGGQKRF